MNFLLALESNSYIIIFMKKTGFIVIVCLIMLSPFCVKKKNHNYVPLEQLNVDKSNDYKYIFKDIISEQKKRAEREKKDPFKD
jgi:hypothetical protein